jgi:hypothetical protein
MNVVCVSGKAGSGKDTMGAVLVKNHGFKRIALADPLRDLCSRVFRIPFNDFLDQNKKDAELDSIITLDFHHVDKIREIVELEWGFEISYPARERMEEYFGEEFETPRDILKLVGTELLRENVREDIWIALAMNKIAELKCNVVVTDVRFQNERDVFSKAGAIMCLIKRPSVDKEDEHSSENTGEDDEYDVIFHNTEELHVFQNEVTLWYKSRENDLTGKGKFKYEY